MRVLNHTPWSTAELGEIACRVVLKELDAQDRKITTVIFAPRGYRVRLLGMLELAEILQCEIVARIYLESPEELQRKGTGWCRREGCPKPYRFHDDADHAFEPIPVDLCLDGRRIAFDIAYAIQRGLGRDHRDMDSKYLEHDYRPWWWASDVALDPHGGKNATVYTDDRCGCAAIQPAEGTAIPNEARRGTSRRGRR